MNARSASSHATAPAAPGEDRVQAVLAHCDGPLWRQGPEMALVSLDGRWLAANPALCRLYGHAEAALVGRHVLDFTPEDGVAETRQQIARGNAGSDEVSLEKRYLHPDGRTLWIHVRAAVVRDGEGQPVCFVTHVRDVSRRHDAEDALREEKAGLERRVAERTAELESQTRLQEQFAYGVSHDLRAPLRAITAFSDLLDRQSGALLDAMSRDHLDRIRSAATRMGRLVDSLLLLSRTRSATLKPGRVDLGLLADWALMDLADKDPQRAVDFDVQQGLYAQGDEHQLRELFNLLLHNAWKFSAGRDRVRIAIEGEQDGDRVRLRIRDHGSGFDPRHAARLFEPFQRLHGPDDGGGDGLGLAIARIIVERHGGNLRAESQPDAGTTIHVELPAAGPEP